MFLNMRYEVMMILEGPAIRAGGDVDLHTSDIDRPQGC
jgi:hypothetical protein